MSKANTPEQKSAYQRLAAILDSIKKYCVETDSWNKPWYILLGCGNSGRSQLLESIHDNWQKFSVNKQATVWISNDANYIEPNAELLQMSDDSLANFWDLFATWLRKNKGSSAINNCYLFLDIKHLYINEDNKLENLAEKTNKQISWLASKFNNTSITITISQFDQLPGLNEYATYLDEHQQTSTLGFPIDDGDGTNHIPRIMTLYDLLVQSITNRIFIILQQCSPDHKKLIEQFPVQLQFFKQKLQFILKKIASPQTIKKVIFISTEQRQPTKNLASKIELNDKFTATNKMYFINQEFITNTSITKPKIKKQIKFKKPEIKLDVKINKKHGIIVLAAFCILFVVGVFLFFESKHDSSVSNMSFQQMLQPSDINTTMEQLNHIYGIIRNENSWRFSWSRWGDRKNYNQLLLHTKNQYQQLLQQKLLPYIVSRIGTNLERPKSDIAAWDNLKLYQMLNNPKHRNSNIVSQWINDNNTEKADNFATNLALHLKNMLQDKQILNSPSKYIINLANAALKPSSIAKAAYSELNNKWQVNQTLAFNNLHTTNGISWNNPKIPTAMQSSQVKNIFDVTIPTYAKKYSQESKWVLSGTNITAPDLEHLDIAIQIQYLEAYNKIWQGIIDGIKVSSDFTNNNTDAWKQLADKDSDFWQNLDVIINNIKPVPGVTNFNKTIGKYFADLSSLSTGNIQKQLAHWQLLRKNILSGSDNYQSAFDFTSQTITNNKTTDLDKIMRLGQTTTAPVGNIITTLAQKDWQQFLTASMQYINFKWNKNVYPTYESLIANKYPIFISKDDINLKDFTSFFGPNGTMDQFFNTYISPYVTTHRMHWTINKKYNSGLKLAKPSLDIFIRSALIQAMFFHDGKLGFNFNLKPNNFSQNTTEFVLNMAGQMVQVLPGDKTEFTLSWPGPEPTFTTIRFSNASESNPTITKTGPWSWFRILDISHIKSTNNVKNYDLTFAIGDDAATFALTNKQIVNPFLPGVLRKFRLQEKL